MQERASGANAGCFLRGCAVLRNIALVLRPRKMGILRGFPLTVFGYFCPTKVARRRLKQFTDEIAAIPAAQQHE